MPMNYLLIHALQTYSKYYKEDFVVEFPSSSGNKVYLEQAAITLAKRLVSIFEPDENGNRPVHNGITMYKDDPHFRDLVLFYEYFHGENAAGLGASHQTGWTGLVTALIGIAGNKV
jgi:hypothetical protein